MAKRRHEELSKESFELWLKEIGYACQNHWIEVDQKDEPPDWFIDFDINRYAIEATSVVDFIWNFNPPSESSSVSSYLYNFIEKVKAQAISDGSLKGGYAVTLAPIPNIKDHEEWLMNEFLSYIDQTKDDESADEYVLGEVNTNTISITKISSEKDYVGLAIGFRAKSEDQASTDLQRILRSALTKKEKALEGISDPVILLILDSYNYSHITDWRNIFLELSIPSMFLSIFRTYINQPAQLLFTRSFWWKNQQNQNSKYRFNGRNDSKHNDT